MRFQISYNTISRILLSFLGLGPGKAYVDITENTIEARFGWSGSVTIRRDTITSIERVDSIPRWLGYGMHGNLRGTWALNGSNSGAVELTMETPATGKVLMFPIRPATVYFSLEDPDGFMTTIRR